MPSILPLNAAVADAHASAVAHDATAEVHTHAGLRESTRDLAHAMWPLRAGAVGIVERAIAALEASTDQARTIDAVRAQVRRVRHGAVVYGDEGVWQLCASASQVTAQWSTMGTDARGTRCAAVRSLATAGAPVTPNAPSRTPLTEPRRATRLLLVDVPERQFEALCSASGADACELIQVDVGDCSADRLEESGAHALLVPIWHMATIAPQAVSVGLPLVALNLRSGPIDRSLPSMSDAAAITSVDIVSDPAATLDVALRIAARARPEGGIVLVVPGTTAAMTAVRESVERFGVRAVAYRDAAQLQVAVERLRPVMVCVETSGTDRAAIDAQHRVLRAVRIALHSHMIPLLMLSAPLPDAELQGYYGAGADDALQPGRDGNVPTDTLHALRRWLERGRLARLARGEHAATGLLLPSAFTRAASAAVQRNFAARKPASIVVARPANSNATDFAQRWAAECRRVAAMLEHEGKSLALGYDDDLGLAVVLDQPVDGAAKSVDGIRTHHTSTGLIWRAGVADLATTGGTDFNYLRSCAREALSATRDDLPLRSWTSDFAGDVPDVIIIEPDTLLSHMLQYAMRASGRSCRALETGHDALEALRSMRNGPRPPLVLMDVDLAGIDGHSLHDHLRVECPGKFEFVFHTVHNAEGEQLRALSSGALDYIIKPVSVRVLLAKIEHWLERRNAREPDTSSAPVLRRAA